MEYQCGNIFVREMRFGGVGSVVEGHAHNFDHVTYVTRGAVLVEKLDGNGAVVRAVVKTAIDGYNWVLIEAGVTHRLTSQTSDALAHCIYSHRNHQGEVVQQYDGWTPGYV